MIPVTRLLPLILAAALILAYTLAPHSLKAERQGRPRRAHTDSGQAGPAELRRSHRGAPRGRAGPQAPAPGAGQPQQPQQGQQPKAGGQQAVHGKNATQPQQAPAEKGGAGSQRAAPALPGVVVYGVAAALVAVAAGLAALLLRRRGGPEW